MKIIDIHTKKETDGNSSHKEEIKNNLVKDYVFQNIDFQLTDEYWDSIDESFAEIWNNKLGRGGYFYWDEISDQIFSILQNQKKLMEYSRVDKIVTLILTYIENDGGFLE